MPEGRSGYGIKITLLPRSAYEALHRDDPADETDQTHQPDPPSGR
ncbi:hypothetical protein [Streptomyces bluensis]|uniref:Uncharacterized protein n=1 Tax=Streptomyces bluensis TaxID=33897 RepID=A0ABW6UPU1_9ACTN